jgi:hypothetical protein
MVEQKWPCPLPSEGRGRRFESFRVRHKSQTLSDRIQPNKTGLNRPDLVNRVTVLARDGGRVPGLFAAAVVAALLRFDPHVLVLSWSADHQETVAATSSRTCEEARNAIAAGRWLAGNPPAAMRCERGSAFAPGSDCIEGFNCPGSGR